MSTRTRVFRILLAVITLAALAFLYIVDGNTFS